MHAEIVRCVDKTRNGLTEFIRRMKQRGENRKGSESKSGERPNKTFETNNVPNILRARNGKRKKRLMRKRATVIVSLVAFVVLCATLSWFFMRINEISVTGNVETTTEEIVEQSQLAIDKHVLFCGLGNAKKNLESNPRYVVDSVEYVFPDRIEITLVEHTTAALIVGVHGIAAIDDRGRVLELDASDEPDEVKVYGLSLMGCIEGKTIGEEYDFRIAALLEIVSFLDSTDNKCGIKIIDMSNPLNVYMVTQSGIRVEIGQPTEIETKMEETQIALVELAKANIAGGTLRVYGTGRPVYTPVDADDTTDRSTTPDETTTTEPTQTSEPVDTQVPTQTS